MSIEDFSDFTYKLRKSQGFAPSDLVTSQGPVLSVKWTPIRSATITKLQSKFSFTILHDCINKLQILSSISGLPSKKYNHQTQTENILNKNYDEQPKISVNKQFSTDDFKLQNDRSYLQSILKETYTNLKLANSFGFLVKAMNNYEKQRLNEYELSEERYRNKIKHEALQLALLKAKKFGYREHGSIVESVGRLKDELLDLEMEEGVKINFLVNWENSRGEQNALKFSTAEKNLTEITRLANIKTLREQRVHDETSNYLNENVHDYQQQIQEWMAKYDEDLEIKENEINTVRIKLDKLTEEYLDKLQLYEQRQQQINEYLEYKEAKRKADEELAIKVEAARRIQAWWRGTMYRRCLGPYRKKKPKGKKDNAKKSKK